ncbi:PREDICTED: L-type lectin-domain containing receptor kinase IX.1-like isoform X2 [Nelumbo nucifera]|uniref:L-type lectin-domain containing receptor kinase IX.1-like isoform X2 n=1 Tax=Nelumbo nucifera TaxID=4432 RepID=A0A1U7YYP8_NELNU|nr:PREDICTED: L-type lectin-domain containing receptor kinase IX.1-like isoform X2 [Nelumbo nucifera]
MDFSRLQDFHLESPNVLIVQSPLLALFLFSLASCALSMPFPFRFENSANVVAKLGNSSAGSDNQSPATGGINNRGLVAGLAAGAGIFLVSCLVVFWLVLRIIRKRDREKEDDTIVLDDSMNDEFEKGTGPKRFSYGELARATRKFAEERKLGEGGFGGVYRGFLRDVKMDVAVKRVSRGSKQGVKEYMLEVKIISRLRHKNLVQLVGWCHQHSELLLVYEFMSNGSLDSYLFKHRGLLTWDIRYKIALGLASALFYLHQGWEQCVLHRDIKSSNVMLDSSFNAKLGDFGLARLIDHEQRSQTTVPAGTMGYMAPEYCITGKASKLSDVYSFGVVALEIACGRKSVELKFEESKMLVEWVWELYGKGELLEAADSRLRNLGFDEKQMECLLIVGLWCAHPNCRSRPSISQVIHVLSFEAPLPTLPPNMPVPLYSARWPSSMDVSSFPTTPYYGVSNSQRDHTKSSINSCTTDSSRGQSVGEQRQPVKEGNELDEPMDRRPSFNSQWSDYVI